MAACRGRSSSSLNVVRSVIAFALVAVLLVLGLIHVYWSLAGSGASKAAVPEVEGRPAFRPSRSATFAVALALFAAAALVGSAGRVAPAWLNLPYARMLTEVLGLTFLVRAVGDFRLVGFFKRVRGSTFARLDTLVYAPLCLILGIASIIVGAFDV
jgi:Protein of unknown function (DUF3995)